MNATDYLPIVEVADAFADSVICARANAFRGKDIKYNHANDAIAAATGGTHGQKVVIAKAHQALHP